MQINTRNPDGSGQRCGAACPLPRRQNAWEGARWSGLLECPCGTRMVKTFDHRRVRDPTPGCTYRSAVPDAAECFAAAAVELKSAALQNVSVSDASLPAGCSLRPGVATFNLAAQQPAATCASLPAGASCVCRAATGYINGQRFDAGCMGEPASELLRDHNPTCAPIWGPSPGTAD